MGNIGAWELVIIVILVIVIFGGRKLPELGRGLGKGLANFRQAVREPDSSNADQPPDKSVSTGPAPDRPSDEPDSGPSSREER